MLPVLGKKAGLEWSMKEGLIGSSFVCPKCGKSMELRERTEQWVTQERLLRENDLNVGKAIEIVRAAEASREQIRNMKNDTATINFVKENQNKPKTQYNCKKCGRKHKPRSSVRENLCQVQEEKPFCC
ncbi:hypothetical protein TNCV_339601 [Trichonephila clavipes]|nr:hypothetical protein TNCV_339601 [Trichonephila clavipes]